MHQVSFVLTARTAMVLHSLIVLWFAAEGHRHYRAPWRPWYGSKSGVCFTDMLNTLRVQSVHHQVLSLRPAGRGHKKLMKTLFHAVQQAAQVRKPNGENTDSR